MVVVPVVLLAGLLWIANGRAKAKLAQQQQAEREDDPPG